jgi:hypothetical protein
MIEETDYCCSCFANLDDFPTQYRVINKLDFPLFEQEWSADEELLLFEGLEKYAPPYAGTASAIGEKSLTSSVLIKLGRMWRTIINISILPELTLFRYFEADSVRAPAQSSRPERFLDPKPQGVIGTQAEQAVQQDCDQQRHALS